ncbi:CheB methylesterase domain-containing protein [Roseinatronobacter sp. NSM]|uniref:CheB methylesterase domain-containing protein n=1 Tax=Roseinatronobacter sp. NSM TaxID=3457785 RepID=UPI0040360E91
MTDPVILIADPNRARRKMLMAICAEMGIDAVIDAGTLGEIYQCAEQHMPKRVAVSVEFVKTHEFDAVLDMLNIISAELLIYGDGPAAMSDQVFRLGGRESAQRLVTLLSAGLTGMRRVPVASRDMNAIASPNAAPVNRLIMIGASTGGITALETILSAFPQDCPPTLVVQHLRPGFAEGLIRRLDETVRPKVVIAENGVPLRMGTVYVAAGSDRHLGLIQRGGLMTRLIDSAPVSGHCPSVDVLFEQGAQIAGRVSINAAILTGMGADGAAGMRSLRAAGAYTVAQDRGSSVVWGMPRVAVEMGGVVDVLPLAFIAKALLRDQSRAAYRQGRAM